MQAARAAIALLAVLAIDAPAGDATHRYVVDVELSQGSGQRSVAQFRVHDAVSHRLVGEREIVYSAAGSGPVSVGATAAQPCRQQGAEGYCMQLSVGTGDARRSADAFIPRHGQLRVALR